MNEKKLNWPPRRFDLVSLGSAKNFTFPIEIIPYDKAVEISPGGKEDPPLGLFTQTMGEPDIFF